MGTTIREKNVKSLPEGRKQPNPLRSDEVKRILNALEECSRQFAEVHSHTAVRRGNLANLLCKDVDFA